jgi:hypothetical protein
MPHAKIQAQLGSNKRLDVALSLYLLIAILKVRHSLWVQLGYDAEFQ